MGLFFMIIFFYYQLSQHHVDPADCEIQEMLASIWPASIPSLSIVFLPNIHKRGATALFRPFICTLSLVPLHP